MFEIRTSAKRFDANKVFVDERGEYPYVVRMGYNNGQKGFLTEDTVFLNAGNTISFGQDTATMYYQEIPYFTGDKIKILYPKIRGFRKENAQFFLTSMQLSFSNFAWGSSQFNVGVLAEQKVTLPTKNNAIDFEFMERFIAELEAQRIAELEAYLSVTGLKDTCMSLDEEHALREFDEIEWDSFNLEKLFGKSTRGKRLKSADRVSGGIPFVTAGEADEGISAFIGNNVNVFSKNTTTIDMFGSAKYRSYDYGGDDHVAVVHTEELTMYAAVFVTSAIHKSSHNGQFDYGHNFYAKDADALYISLPVTAGQRPDYAKMETIISAIHKLVIKDVVAYSDRKIKATQIVAGKQESR